MTSAYPLSASSRNQQTKQVVADFRSDTVTKPSEGMRDAIANAVVGDDVYGEDETVNRLETDVSEMMGKQAGLFCPTGTQSNFLALLSHCQRGEEIIVGRSYHVFSAEAAGASVLGGIALAPVNVEANGQICAGEIEATIKPDDSHCPISRLLSLENTVSGFAIPLEACKQSADIARKYGLSVHLDGARIFNAAIGLGVDVSAIASVADTVSVCLSKGLGIPAGSVLCGDVDFIRKARRWRKMAGGGMRQAGILAAAGLYALEHHIDDLAEDHRRATILREFLNGFDALTVTMHPGQTNMVHIEILGTDPTAFVASLSERGIILGSTGAKQRIVLHRDIDDNDLDAAMDAFASVLKVNASSI